ncbi:MAG: aminotransferase class V-fold PLP-dependent enzyme [Planctomycetes bacterium]|nr:aminotransferase class V-fold PLP-dependent enzyme [Planctomycetota bacterium]
MNPEDFRRFGHRLVDLVADYRAGIEARPVASSASPGSIRAQLPMDPPEEPEDFERVLADLERLVVPNLTHWQHPRFFGYFPSNGELAAVLGDCASTGLGVLGLAWASSPPLTEIEEVTTDWLRRMSGLSEAWSGVIQDTASTSTLVALLCAREQASGFSLARGGLQGEDKALVVYTSEHAHSSVDKAVLMAGFGRANCRKIPVDPDYALRADALESAIRADRAAGRVPCAIVATTGTTTTTALDPVDACARIAREHHLWLHVDAAMAGSAMILPECRSLWPGVEGADSIVVNPHKWLGASFDCSVYFVRDPEQLVRVMSTSPSYLQTAADGQVRNYRDWGIPLGRRFRALKLWFLIREQGLSGLRKRLRRDLANARWLAEEVRREPDWRVLAPVPLQTVCVRHEPPGLAGDALDGHTLRWVDAVNRSGVAYLTPAILDGRWMARVSIGALPTEREHVAQAWAAMRAATAHSTA